MKCPICDCDSEFEFISKIGQFEMRRCKNCDVIFSDPMKNPGAATYEQSPGGIAHKILGDRPGWWHEQFFRLFPSGNGMTILDIGCASGIFLNEAGKRGFRVSGLDFDVNAIEIARTRFGLEDVHSMTPEEFNAVFPNRKFDVVTMFEIIEHVDNPALLVQTGKALMNEGGSLAISTPNRDRTMDVIKEIDKPPVHLTRWSKKSLSKFLERNGFCVVHFTVKRLDHPEVASYLQGKLRFGVATKLAEKAAATGQQNYASKAKRLTGMKSVVTSLITLPIAPIVRGLRLQGFGMFCVCKASAVPRNVV